MKIQNNNIKCVSPIGRTYLLTIYQLKRFLELLNGEWETVEVENKGLVDKQTKWKGMVSRYVKDAVISDSYMENIQEQLENNNNIVTIKEWKFSLIDDIPIELQDMKL